MPNLILIHAEPAAMGWTAWATFPDGSGVRVRGASYCGPAVRLVAREVVSRGHRVTPTARKGTPDPRPSA